jgi:hypothetical protein
MLEFLKLVPTRHEHYQKIQVFKMMFGDTKYIFGYIYEDKLGFDFRPDKDVALSFPVLQEITQFIQELEADSLYEQVAAQQESA